MSILVPVIAPIGILHILRGGGSIAVFIQEVIGCLLVLGQFALPVDVVGSRSAQDPGIVADGSGTVSFGDVVHPYCRGPSCVIGPAGLVVVVILSHILIDIVGSQVIVVIGVIIPLRHLGPDIMIIIHVLAGDQAVDLDLPVFVLFRFWVVHLCGHPFVIHILIGIGIIAAHRRQGILGMTEFADAVPGPHGHIFRLVLHPGVVGLVIFLDFHHFIAFPGNQIAF